MSEIVDKISVKSLEMEHGPETLYEKEVFWRDHQVWLKDHGYLLRPRYHPGWEASWRKTEDAWMDNEDGIPCRYPFLLDATRISNGTKVMIKRVNLSEYPAEVELARTFSSEPYASDPKNHCIPVYDVLKVPGTDDVVLFVMPLLYNYDEPEFETIGEIVEFFHQVIEGLQFLHQHNVAHRDYKAHNIMGATSVLFSKPPHPFHAFKAYDFSGPPTQSLSRTEMPVKYHVIDFGLSKKYDSKEGHLEEPPWGGYSREVPEFRKLDHCDPFPIDVFYLGWHIRKHFIAGSSSLARIRGLGFMDQLTLDMIKENPKDRPTINEVMNRFEKVVQGLGWWKLRSRVCSKDEPRFIGEEFSHWKKQIKLILKHVPAIPTPHPVAN